MKNFGQLVLGTILCSVASANTVITPENAKNGIEKMMQTGFLKPSVYIPRNKQSSRSLAKRYQGRNRQFSKRKAREESKPHSQIRGHLRHLHTETDDWNDDYFTYYDDDYFSDVTAPTAATTKSGKAAKSVSTKSPTVSTKAPTSKGGKSTKSKGTKTKSAKTKSSKSSSDSGTSSPTSTSSENVYEIQGFIDTRNTDAPIYVDPENPDEYASGTVFTYVDTPIWEFDGVNTSALIGLVQGSCTRTDDSDDAVFAGTAYCTLTMEALLGSEVVASLTAEGTVVNEDNADSLISTLTVTSGLGEFAGISGWIFLFSAFLDTSSNPNIPVPDSSLDFLSETDGFVMYGVLYSDNELTVLEEALLGDDDDFVDDDDDFFATDDTTDDDTTGDDTTDDFFATASPTADAGDDALDTVLCDGQEVFDFCDCSSDCINFPDTRCGCEEAQTCCGLDSVLPTSGDILSMGTPVKEKATGIFFPPLCNGFSLAGTGVRVKWGFVKVYAVGTYLDPVAMMGVKKGSNEEIKKALLDPTYPRTIRIVMNRGLAIQKFTDALVESIQPRLKGQELETLEQFKKLSPPVDLVEGAEIEMTIRGDTLLFKNAVGGVGSIHSRLFCEAMCDIYYGDDAVSPSHLDEVIAGVRKL
eukprot:Nitzschia sp. Nitz4//scaffold71_size96697//70465//73240//NITZ4_004704-RA/size96697-processed-gene-0.13-mRNA-1//1//CDS//3329557274//5797//frame0